MENTRQAPKLFKDPKMQLSFEEEYFKGFNKERKYTPAQRIIIEAGQAMSNNFKQSKSKDSLSDGVKA